MRASRTRRPPPLLQSALFDFPSLLVVLLLFCCTCAYLRGLTYKPSGGKAVSMLDNATTGLASAPWKAARIGERCSPAISLACVVMALYTLLVK